MPLQIHWQEGLFLQPHHLQRMQKSFFDLVAAERRLAWPYPYGVIDARLSGDELENLRLRFDRLHAVMPSGAEVKYPDTAELPSLDIKQAFSQGAGSFQVFLGIPLWQNARANTLQISDGADTRAKLVFRIGEMEVMDENTGENPKPLQVRRINARLMLENEDHADMERIPLLRVVRATGEDVGLPKADPEFVPPCLVLNGSGTLRELVRDLVSQVEATRGELVVQIARPGLDYSSLQAFQIRQMMELRSLNHYSARLPALLAAPNVTPFAMYLELRALHGELAALHPDRDDFECPAYQHDHPFNAFQELSKKIRQLLKGEVQPSFLKVLFESKDGLLSAELTEEHFTKPNAYYLAVKSRLDPKELARFIEDGDKFKFMPRSLSTRAIRGVELKEERHQPLGLPASSDLHYYLLDRHASSRIWGLIQDEKNAIIRWTNTEVDLNDAAFTLYMTVPNA